MTQSRLCGLILAAGDSSRMGRDKALLPWPPPVLAPPDLALPDLAPADLNPHPTPHATLLAACIRALQPITQQIVVVAGHNIDALAPIVSACGVLLAHNPAPERGQFSSMHIGLRRIVDLDYGAAALTPVDAPPLQHATLTLLLSAFEDALTRNLWAIAPAHHGKHGHPLFAARPLIDAFLAAPVAANARAVRQAHTALIQYLSVDDPLVGAEMNTPRQYAAFVNV